MKSLWCGITYYRPTDRQTNGTEQTGVEDVRSESALRHKPSNPRGEPNLTRGTEHTTLRET